MFDTDSNKQVPEWAKTLTEKLGRMIELVEDVQTRQTKLEARLFREQGGKPEKEESASNKVTPEQIKDVCDKLYI